MKNRVHTVIRYVRSHLEGFIWLGALLLLATMSPTESSASLCPVPNLGLGFCPGCGLGHGISAFLHGDLAASWQAHPLAIPALAILGWRTVTVFRKKKLQTQNTY